MHLCATCSNVQPHEAPSGVTLAGLLVRVKAELERAAADVARVQIDSNGQGGVLVSGEDLWASLQNLDLVEQTLRGLAGVLGNVHDHGLVTQNIAVETIIKDVTLASLASRLCDLPVLAAANDEAEFF